MHCRRLSITQAILLPWVGAGAVLPEATVPMEPVVLSRLRTVRPASALHLALMEVVRRQYKLAMQNADQADADPMHASGARTYRLRPWLLAHGSIGVRVSLSNPRREII